MRSVVGEMHLTLTAKCVKTQLSSRDGVHVHNCKIEKHELSGRQTACVLFFGEEGLPKAGLTLTTFSVLLKMLLFANQIGL